MTHIRSSPPLEKALRAWETVGSYVMQPLLGERWHRPASGRLALLSEIRSFSLVHLELGLLKGPKIAKPLKRELHERTEERDPTLLAQVGFVVLKKKLFCDTC